MLSFLRYFVSEVYFSVSFSRAGQNCQILLFFIVNSSSKKKTAETTETKAGFDNHESIGITLQNPEQKLPSRRTDNKKSILVFCFGRTKPLSIPDCFVSVLFSFVSNTRNGRQSFSKRNQLKAHITNRTGTFWPLCTL